MLKHAHKQLTKCTVWPRLPSLTYSRAFASETESAIQGKLESALTVRDVGVRDTSGGCGTMFEIKVVAEDFRNKSIVQQHKLVTKVLKEDISQWHGFTLITSAPSHTNSSSS